MWADDKQRVGRKDPDRRHLRDREGLRRPSAKVSVLLAANPTLKRDVGLHREVDATTKEHRQPTIDPEEHTHDLAQPWSSVRIVGTVLSHIDEDGAKTDQPSRNEQTFGRVEDRRQEG